MKGIILHGGQGTRLRPLTYAGPKQLIPIANKPVSQYALEDLISIGVGDIAIILGETFPELVRQYYGDGSKFGVRLTYIYQGRPLGIAHAVSLCKDFAENEDFVVYLGDNMFQNGIKKYADSFLRAKPHAMVLLKEVGEPSRFGVAELGGDGRLVRLVEKPKVPPSNYAVVGLYFFKSVVFEAISKLRPSWRGELEITDAIQNLLNARFDVLHSFVDGWWADTGKKDDLLSLNATVLDERIKRNLEGELVNSRVEGRVEIGEGSKIVNSAIRGPAIVGKGCSIEDSHIGPHTSVGDGCALRMSSVENCIIMSGAVIEGIDRLEESLIGKNAKVLSVKDTRRRLKLHIGDYSEVVV